MPKKNNNQNQNKNNKPGQKKDMKGNNSGNSGKNKKNNSSKNNDNTNENNCNNDDENKDDDNKDDDNKDDDNKDDENKNDDPENDNPENKKKPSIILLIDKKLIDDDNNYDDPFSNIFDDPYDNHYNDPYNDHYNNDYNNNDGDDHECNDNDCDDHNNGKRKNRSMDNIFKSIINSIHKKETKKRKVESIDDFKQYFKESSILLPINREIKNLKDLIDLGKSYDPFDENRYVINLRALHKCVKPLEELEKMIGMKNIKEMIVDLIFFRLQNLEDKKEELWHLVIQGTPGSGKTEVAKIIGKIYYSLGITKKDKFTLVKRSDLIGKYLGHTAKLTQEVFDNAKGGILFIDEAYSLGNPEQRDSFSKECIDTINQNLTENKETVVFIAGYKDQLNESFFSYNPGLNRRFKMRLTVDKYNANDLREIFIKKIKENDWSIMDNNLDKELPLTFFEKNINLFKYNGGDMENLWHLTKIVHSRRIFGKDRSLMKNITIEDLENALKLYCENDEVKNRDSKDIEKYLLNTMYC